MKILTMSFQIHILQCILRIKDHVKKFNKSLFFGFNFLLMILVSVHEFLSCFNLQLFHRCFCCLKKYFDCIFGYDGSYDGPHWCILNGRFYSKLNKNYDVLEEILFIYIRLYIFQDRSIYDIDHSWPHCAFRIIWIHWFYQLRFQNIHHKVFSISNARLTNISLTVCKRFSCTVS
jgi:hypothetical protein